MQARRRKFRFLSIPIAASMAFTSVPAQAWNARGHMTVAGIAWVHMTPRARARAIELLRRNPDYRNWIQDVPAADQDRYAFMEAATWPDDLKNRVCSNAPTCIRDEGYTPADADEDLNIGYRDLRLRRYWHFKDLPFSTDGTALEEPFRVNAETQIVAFSGSLNTQLDDEAQSYNLTWLLHMVGDVHQPLHATQRFSEASPHGDSGGNGVVICRPAPATCITRNENGRRPDTLHGLWDDAIGTGPEASSAARKADKLLADMAVEGSLLARLVARTDLNAAPATWFTESAALAQRYAYASPIGPGRGPFYPTATYRENAGSIAEQRILIAGLRLAELLNRRLG